MGALGALLPLLPTTPFLLLASFFFVRSSPRLHAWLLGNRLFGPFLRDWNRYRGVSRRVKLTAVGMILLVGGASAASGRLPYPLLLLLFALLGLGLTVVLRLRTIEAGMRVTDEFPLDPSFVPVESSDEGQAIPEEMFEPAGGRPSGSLQSRLTHLS